MSATFSTPLAPVLVLSEVEWRARQEAHRTRLAAFVEAHLERRRRAIKHPVWDFLFEYYAFRPSHLLRWVPGAGVLLQGEAAREFTTIKGFEWQGDGALLPAASFPEHRREGLSQALELLQASAERLPTYGCYGLHEWAMVYRCKAVRHGAVPLRPSADEIADVVEEGGVRCTHYDAFRFFTPAAVPLNLHQPTPDNRPALEQRGCIHANMDLYKWAGKYDPWLPAELKADAFDLAREARAIDMRASPYDLAAHGFEPIPIETREGKAEYVAQQRLLAEKAQPIRLRLIEACSGLL